MEKTLSVRGSSPGSQRDEMEILPPLLSKIPKISLSKELKCTERRRSSCKCLPSSWRALQKRSSLGFPKPAELLECCCLIPVPCRGCGGAGSCSFPTLLQSANLDQPRFGGFWCYGATRSCPADSQLFSQDGFEPNAEEELLPVTAGQSGMMLPRAEISLSLLSAPQPRMELCTLLKAMAIPAGVWK